MLRSTALWEEFTGEDAGSFLLRCAFAETKINKSKVNRAVVFVMDGDVNF